MNAFSLLLISQVIWIPIALGAGIQEFKKPQEPFNSTINALTKGLRKSMLPTLSGVIDSEDADTVYRIAEIGGWGSYIYTLYFNKESIPILVTYSSSQVEDMERRFPVMRSQRFVVDTNDRRIAASKFSWKLYDETADQVLSGKLEPIGGDDIPFVLVERISKSTGYSGIFLPSNIYTHFEKLGNELEKMVKELQALELVR